MKFGSVSVDACGRHITQYPSMPTVRHIVGLYRVLVWPRVRHVLHVITHAALGYHRPLLTSMEFPGGRGCTWCPPWSSGSGHRTEVSGNDAWRLSRYCTVQVCSIGKQQQTCEGGKMCGSSGFEEQCMYLISLRTHECPQFNGFWAIELS